MDVARFGDWTTPAYTRDKVTENYQRRFAISYPNEELPAARPFHTTPAYGIWKGQRAVFGVGYGLEHVNYFAPEGEPLEETPSFRRSNAFGPVGAECRAVRDRTSASTRSTTSRKYAVTGPDAEGWLNGIMAGRIPAEGRMALIAHAEHHGRLIGDFTVAKLGPERFRLTASLRRPRPITALVPGAPAGEGRRDCATSRSTRSASRSPDPSARELLQPRDPRRRLERGAAVPGGPADGGRADPRLGRPRHLHRRPRLRDLCAGPPAGCALSRRWPRRARDMGLRPFGMRAMMSLRLEKSFGSWMREFKPDYTPGRDWPRPLRQLQEERFHRPRRGAEGQGRGGQAQARHLRGRRRRRRRASADEPIWHKMARWSASSPPAVMPTASGSRSRSASCRPR